MEKLQEGGYTCVLWNSVPGDYRDPDGWLERALSDYQSRDWTLIALHDKPNGAMAHLEAFITRLKAAGTEFRQEFPPALRANSGWQGRFAARSLHERLKTTG